MKEENAELRKRLNETSSLESAKNKAEAKAEQLEQKVRHTFSVRIVHHHWTCVMLHIDGRNDSREGHAEGERAECNL